MKVGRLALSLFALIWSGSAVSQSFERAIQESEAIQRNASERYLEDRRSGPVRPVLPEFRQVFSERDENSITKIDRENCHAIDRLSIIGLEVIGVHHFDTIKRRFTNSCITVEDIEKAMTDMTNVILALGYVTTRVYLPDQDLSKGTLKISVLEGVLERLEVIGSGKGGVRSELVIPADVGSVLNLRDLELGLGQLNRLSSNNAALNIVPGSLPGRSIVFLENEQGPYFSGFLRYDNHGSESSGRDHIGLGITAQNFFGVNESIGLIHRRSVPVQDGADNRSSSTSINLGLYWGYLTLLGSIGTSDYSNRLALASGREFGMSGRSNTASIGYEYVLLNRSFARFSIGSDLSVRDARNYFAGELLEISSRRTSEARISGVFQASPMGGQFQMTLGISQGLRFAGAVKDDPELSGDDNVPRAQYRLLDVQMAYSRSFLVIDIPVAFLTTISGQIGLTPLFGTQQFVIGGLNSVRGYGESSFSEDSGYFSQNSFSIYPESWVFGPKGRLYASVGYDFGQVRSRFSRNGTTSLTGLVFGFGIQQSSLNVSLSYSKPHYSSSFVTAENQRVFVSLNLKI